MAGVLDRRITTPGKFCKENLFLLMLQAHGCCMAVQNLARHVTKLKMEGAWGHVNHENSEEDILWWTNGLCLSVNLQAKGLCLVNGAVMALWETSYSMEEKQGIGQIYRLCFLYLTNTRICSTGDGSAVSCWANCVVRAQTTPDQTKKFNVMLLLFLMKLILYILYSIY